MGFLQVCGFLRTVPFLRALLYMTRYWFAFCPTNFLCEQNSNYLLGGISVEISALEKLNYQQMSFKNAVPIGVAMVWEILNTKPNF